MQDANEILRGGLFTDRRLRVPTNGHHQALNCPRCNSLNTKFCYYNNYNLSQPRYFCKNCRRYWTKGGVLRNVPVGGGCRKSKRSSKRKIASSSPKTNSAPMAPIQPCSGVNANFDPFQAGAGVSTAAPAGVGMFAEIEGFGDEGQHNLLGFGEIETTPFEQNQLLLQQLSSVSRDWQKEKIDGVGDDWGSEIYDQISNSKIGDEVLAVPDWNGDSRGGDGGMFDLTHGSEWSESSQWNESDHHLYLPP